MAWKLAIERLPSSMAINDQFLLMISFELDRVVIACYALK